MIWLLTDSAVGSGEDLVSGRYLMADLDMRFRWSDMDMSTVDGQDAHKFGVAGKVLRMCGGGS
jgi:hypothetical protein